MNKFSASKWLNWNKISGIMVLCTISLILISMVGTQTLSTSEISFENAPTFEATSSDLGSTPITATYDENSTAVSLNTFDQATTLYDQAEPFFNDNYVHEIDLYFEDEDWYDELYAGHAYDSDDPYFPAKFVYDGIEIDQIGINFKGHSSFMGTNYKKSFRIDFNYYDEEVDFFGLKKLNLNNGYMDPTFMKEKLFWDFAGNYVESVRCTFTRININGEYFGLFTAIEHIDDEFIESRFGSKEDGNIFRAESAGTLNYLGERESLYEDSYELKTNEYENDYSGLVSLTDVLTNTPIETFQEEIEKILDVNDTLHSMALLNLFASLDSYLGSAHNFYLYESELSGQFTHILWDSNEAFGRFTFGLEDGEDVRTIDPFWTPSSTSMGIPGVATSELSDNDGDIDGLPPGPPPGDDGGGGGGGNEFSDLNTDRPLFERLMEVEEYQSAYLQIMAGMIRDGFNVDAMSEKIQFWADLIRADVYADPNRIYTTSQFEATLTDGYSNTNNIFGLQSFVDIRSSYLTGILDSYAEKTDLRLNEISTLNNGTCSDQEGEFEAWVEIYNLGPGTVNLEDIYLTDDPEDPDKWEFSSIDLDDGDFYLVWADAEVSEGDDHISFTIQENGGSLYLYEESDVGIYDIIDSVTYPVLGENSSYGKFPDGTGEWQVMDDFPSPNEKNLENSLDVKLPENLYINEIQAENYLTIEDPDDSGEFPDWIELYNAGNESIDLGGMYLTDFLMDPTIWQIPEESVIEPHSYRLIWADGDLELGDLHASFKLSGDGEEIGLISNDGLTIIDSIQFSASIRDFSVGRIPDGSDNIESLISTPTPGSENANIITEDTSEIQNIIVYFIFGSVVVLGIAVNYFSKKNRHAENGQFWLSVIPKSENDVFISVQNVEKGEGV